MQATDEQSEWNDTVIELRPRDFVLDEGEGPPEDPKPPGGSRAPPKPKELLWVYALSQGG